MLRLAILALLPALFAEPAPAQAGGQTKTQAELDATAAAQTQLRINSLQLQQNKGVVSRETAVKEIAEGRATMSRLRKKYEGTPYLADYDREFQAQLRALRGEAQPGRAGRSLIGLTGSLLSMLIYIVPLAVIGWLGMIAVQFFNRISERREERPSLSETYGSAAYADHITTIPDPFYFMTGVFFGKSSKPEFKLIPPEQNPGAPIFSWSESHSLIVGRTRSGKFTRVAAVTQAKFFGSMIIVDPKGECASVCSRERARWQGDDVHILNPWGELAGTFQKLGFKPASYNPLDILDRDDPNAVAIAQALASAICPKDPKAKDSYWSDAAGSLLTAVLLWLTDQPGETKTLARAREIVTKSRSDLKEKFLVKMAASEAFGGAIRENAASFIDLAPETYSGVMSNLSQHTKFLSDPQVKAATATSSFSMEDLVQRPATVYLVIPPDRIETQRTWLRLVITAAMHTFKRATQRGPHRCMFLIDELPQLQLQMLVSEIATAAGYGVDFTLIIQGLDQLKAVYGDSHETIINNCAFKWFCNVGDLHSAEYLSKMLGKATVGTTSTTLSDKSSLSFGETGRPLLMPDEILNLGRDTALLIHPEMKPVYLRTVDYWKVQEAFASMKDEHPKMFWNPAPQFDPNPYRRQSSKA